MAPSNCGSRITTAAALVPTTRAASCTISRGSALLPTGRLHGSPIACRATRPRSRRSATAASPTGAIAPDRPFARTAAPSAASCATPAAVAIGGSAPAATAASAWRLDEGDEQFDDGRLGPQVQQPSAQCGDLLARDRHGQWTYQFAVTVDDMQDGVDFVVRGMDLLPSTGRQIALARLLGRSRPPAVRAPPAHPRAVRREVEQVESRRRPRRAPRRWRVAGRGDRSRGGGGGAH